MIVLTKKDFRCVTVIHLCQSLHTFFTITLGPFSKTPCVFLEGTSKRLDRRFFKSKAFELGRKKNIAIFPTQTGLHPYLTLIREFAAVPPPPHILQEDSSAKDAHP